MRTRSRHFIISGAIGGFVGFLLGEIVMRAFFPDYFPGATTSLGNIVGSALWLAPFGLAVGGALGATEGFVQRKKWRMVYGLVIGLALGAVGGFLGGATGQTIFGLIQAPKVAQSSNTDVVIALDSSSSMRHFLPGREPPPFGSIDVSRGS